MGWEFIHWGPECQGPSPMLYCLIPRKAEKATEMPSHGPTWIDPEETSGAAKILPGQCWVSPEVLHENRVQGFRHVDAI